MARFFCNHVAISIAISATTTVATTVALALAFSSGLTGCSDEDSGPSSDGDADILDAGVAPDTTVPETDGTADSDIPSRAADVVPAKAHVVVVPSTLNFGAMKLEEKATRSFKVFNKGVKPVRIVQIALSPLSKVKSVDVKPDSVPHEIAPGASTVFNVTVLMSKPVPATDTEIAGIMLHTVDPDDAFAVKIVAKLATAIVSVPQGVDFGVAAAGAKIERRITVGNIGGGPLKVTKLAVWGDTQGEFHVQPALVIPGTSTPTSATLQPGQQAEAVATFTSKSATGQALAQLRVQVDGADVGVAVVSLHAVRAAAAACIPVLVPDQVDFGFVPWGGKRIVEVVVQNAGLGTCVFKQALIRACPASAFGPLAGPPTCQVTQPVNPSFSIVGTSPSLFSLASGKSGHIKVALDAPLDAGFFADPKALQKRFGFLALRFAGGSGGPANWYPHDPTDAAKIKTYKPNLVATVGKTYVHAFPGAVDFGFVPKGCSSAKKGVKIFSSAGASAWLTAAELQGCGAAIQATSPPITGSGLEVHPTVPVPRSWAFSPSFLGPFQCTAILHTGVSGTCVDATGKDTGKTCINNKSCYPNGLCKGVSFSIPLSGVATATSDRTEVFIVPKRQVDVLVVVDNSPGMIAHQLNFAAKMATLVNALAVANVDYRIGITTTDMKGGLKGALMALSGARWIDKATKPTPALALKQHLQLGKNGSMIPQGLAAAHAALSIKHSYNSCDSGGCTPCKTDTHCGNGQVCTEVDGSKACGGANRGFRRSSADLAVIFLSSDDDNSPGVVQFYGNFLHYAVPAASKSVPAPGAATVTTGYPRVTVHAIVGPKPKGCAEQYGLRYGKIVDLVGGTVGDICSQSHGPGLAAIAKNIVAATTRVKLSSAVKAYSLKVKVGGKPCGPTGPGTWTFDSATSILRFATAPGGACAPKPGDTVDISYQLFCKP